MTHPFSVMGRCPLSWLDLYYVYSLYMLPYMAYSYTTGTPYVYVIRKQISVVQPKSDVGQW